MWGALAEKTRGGSSPERGNPGIGSDDDDVAGPSGDLTEDRQGR